MIKIKKINPVSADGAGRVDKSMAEILLVHEKSIILFDVDREYREKSEEESGRKNIISSVEDATKTRNMDCYTDETLKLFGKVDVFFVNTRARGIARSVANDSAGIFGQVPSVDEGYIWLRKNYIEPVAEDRGHIVIRSSLVGCEDRLHIDYDISKVAVISVVKNVAFGLTQRATSMSIRNVVSAHSKRMHYPEAGFVPDYEDKPEKGFE